MSTSTDFRLAALLLSAPPRRGSTVSLAGFLTLPWDRPHRDRVLAFARRRAEGEDALWPDFRELLLEAGAAYLVPHGEENRPAGPLYDDLMDAFHPEVHTLVDVGALAPWSHLERDFSRLGSRTRYTRSMSLRIEGGSRLYAQPFLPKAVLPPALQVAPASELDDLFARLCELAPEVALACLEDGVPVAGKTRGRDLTAVLSETSLVGLLTHPRRSVRERALAATGRFPPRSSGSLSGDALSPRADGPRQGRSGACSAWCSRPEA